MWDTVAELPHDVQSEGPRYLSHDLPCVLCGHAAHSFLPCSDRCACTPPATSSLPSGRRAAR